MIASLGDRRDEQDRAEADERRLHGRRVQLVARRQGDRLRPSHQRRQRQPRHREHLRRRRSPTDGPDRWSRRTGRTRIPIWSPDGTRIAFESAMAKPFFYYTNTAIAIVPAAGGTPREHQHGVRRESVTGRVDAVWPFLHRASRTPGRISTASIRATHAVSRHAPAERWIGSGFSLTRDGRTTAFIASDATTFPEVYVAPVASMQHAQADGLWRAGRRVAGRADRGRVLEEPGRRGDRRGAPQAGRVPVGPEISSARRHSRRPDGRLAPDAVQQHVDLSDRPVGRARRARARAELSRERRVRRDSFARSTSAILASAMPGTCCRASTHLIAQGMADPDRVGTMGWSQGGYISAFLTTHDSARFKAVSVGAGISDWMTYYVNTDIHPFTRQYLKATPWEDPGDLCEDVADHLYQGGEGSDADSARRHRSARAAAQCVRAVPGPAGRRCADETDRLQGIRGRRARPVEAEVEPRRHATQPRVVRPVHLARLAGHGHRSAPLALGSARRH